MKNMYVKGGDGRNSLPIIIKMFQYNKAWLVSNFGFSQNSKSTAALGNMGDKFFDFSVDCSHEFLGTYKAAINDDPFKSINDILRSSSNPTIKREDLVAKYFIIECPDFGNQAMTSFYRDFVPQVWFNGKKIWQKYIGMIKFYPRRLAYILIPKTKTASKEYLNTNITSEVKSTDYEHFIIRAAFKNNIEDIYAIDNKKEYYSLKTTFNATHEEIAKITLENIDVFTSRDVHEDFDLYFRETGQTPWRKVLNSRMFYKLELSPDPDSGYVVQRQTRKGFSSPNLTNIDPNIDINSAESYDYYKQSYFRDYVDNDKNKKDQEYNRPAGTQYTLYLTLSLDANAKSVEVCLVPRSNLFDAMYITKNTYGKFDLEEIRKYYPVKYPEDILVFGEDGSKVKDPASELFLNNNPVGMNYEIIPEYSSIKKYEWKDVSGLELTSTGISTFLKENSIYPWATNHPEVLCFDGNGSLCDPVIYKENGSPVSIVDETTEPSTVFGDVTIYWNEEEHITNVSAALGEIESSVSASELTQFTQDDASLFASSNKSYDVLTDENFVTRVDLVDNDEDTSVDTKYSAVFPYNNSNDELSYVLESNEPKFHVDEKNYVYLNLDNSNNEIDYDNFKEGIAKLTANSTEYKYIRNDTEKEVDEQFDNLSKNIIDMFFYGNHAIYNETPASNSTVPYNSVSEYFLLKFTNENKAAVYLLEENQLDEYSDLKAAEFVTVFKRGNDFYGLFIPDGDSSINVSKAKLYSPNNHIQTLYTLRQE